MQFNHIMENQSTDNIDNLLSQLNPYAVKNETEQTTYTNPFYLSGSGSELLTTKYKFLQENYKHIYVLCLADQLEKSSDNLNRIKLFYRHDSDMSELKGQSKLVVLVQCPIDLIKSNNIKSGLLVVDKNNLEIFNLYSYNLKEKELVFLMLETTETHVKSWLKVYENETNLNIFIQQKIFTGYYGIDDRVTKNYLINLMNNIGDFHYWQDENHCKASINHAFSDRKFNLAFTKNWNVSKEEIESEMNKLLLNFNQDKKVIRLDGNYQSQFASAIIEKKVNKPARFVDGSSKDDISFYKIDSLEDLTIDEKCIEELLTKSSLDEKEKYFLICNLIVSKKYCHYVLNNSLVLKENKKIFDKYLPIFRYLIGYAWSIFYIEESIKKSKSTMKDRHIFDINTASQLPVFPFCPEDPHLNPYYCHFVNKNISNPSKNINGIGSAEMNSGGIVNLEEFKRRFKIFSSGANKNFILEGIDWTNMAVTGGAMAAIIPKINPLFSNFLNEGTFKDRINNIADDELESFFKEHYGSSDIDIACNHSNILNFIAHVLDTRTIVSNNIGVKPSEIKITPIKTLCIYISADILKKKCANNDFPYSYAQVVADIEKNYMRMYFFELYYQIKTETNKKNKNILGKKIEEDEYFEILNYCSMDKTTIIISDFDLNNQIVNRLPENNDGIELNFTINESTEADTVFIKFVESLKYRISSKKLLHSLEVFRINEDDFISCVSRFHLACVRSYYDGKNCYMTPSAITAYQTFTNVDFKYFVGCHDPIHIIDKYRNRGYGTILNEIEIKQYIAYILCKDEYSEKYDIDKTKDTTYESKMGKILGVIPTSHKYYNRASISEKTKKELKVTIPNWNPDKITEFFKLQYKNYNAEFSKMKTIADDGNICPLKYWIIEASYDMLK